MVLYLQPSLIATLFFVYSLTPSPAVASRLARCLTVRCTVSIRLRHHFASKLQRMCAIVKVREHDDPARFRILVKGMLCPPCIKYRASFCFCHPFCSFVMVYVCVYLCMYLCMYVWMYVCMHGCMYHFSYAAVTLAGSPEMVGTLLGTGPGQPSPQWYEATHRHLARQGLRVIALAYAPVAPGLAESVSAATGLSVL